MGKVQGTKSFLSIFSAKVWHLDVREPIGVKPIRNLLKGGQGLAEVFKNVETRDEIKFLPEIRLLPCGCLDSITKLLLCVRAVGFSRFDSVSVMASLKHQADKFTSPAAHVECATP